MADPAGPHRGVTLHTPLQQDQTTKYSSIVPSVSNFTKETTQEVDFIPSRGKGQICDEYSPLNGTKKEGHALVPNELQPQVEDGHSRKKFNTHSGTPINIKAKEEEAWSEALLLAPPAQAAAPASHGTHPAALHPQTPSGFRSPPSRQGPYPSLALRGYPVASPRTPLRIVRFPESFSKDPVLRSSSPFLQILFRG
ncbi:hypothetical protein E5288_WYG012278 [Bos mutus]|uniref:Uncharacterized protein n=1 Tax=Bos mutus TaxID=72004 RepID=A0A6B0RFX3_9CETA|nr:hypothetical protein [Bos mutus]